MIWISRCLWVALHPVSLNFRLVSDDSDIYENEDDAAFRLRELRMLKRESTVSDSSNAEINQIRNDSDSTDSAPKLRPRVVNISKPSPRAPPEDHTSKINSKTDIK